MGTSYKKLWKMLIDRDMSKSDVSSTVYGINQISFTHEISGS